MLVSAEGQKPSFEHPDGSYNIIPICTGIAHKHCKKNNNANIINMTFQ